MIRQATMGGDHGTAWWKVLSSFRRSWSHCDSFRTSMVRNNTECTMFDDHQAKRIVGDSGRAAQLVAPHVAALQSTALRGLQPDYSSLNRDQPLALHDLNADRLNTTSASMYPARREIAPEVHVTQISGHRLRRGNRKFTNACFHMIPTSGRIAQQGPRLCGVALG